MNVNYSDNHFILNNRKGVERTASGLPVLDGSKSREAKHLEKVLMEMRNRIHKMGDVPHNKSGSLDVLLITLHNERTEILADLMNSYFLAKTLLLSLITQTHILGEKPHCGHPKQEKEMRPGITLQHMIRKETCPHL